MAKAIAEAILRGISYVRMHPQFIFTLVLIFLIPVAFLYSGQQFLSVSNKNIERIASDRIGLMQDVFADVVKQNYDNPELLISYIETIQKANHDISKLYVVSDDLNHLTIVAALDESLLGATTTVMHYYRASLTNEGESSLSPFIGGSGERYWEVYRPVRLKTGDVYYIFAEVQLADIDNLFTSRIKSTYLVLLALMLVVLFLAYRHIKLIDYGYLYRKADEAVKTRDLFTNMVTHELRAPLTAIRGYASMMSEDDKLDKKAKEQATRIEQSSARLLLIVNDLLEVARLQSGKLKVELSEVEIETIVPAVISALESSAKEKSINLKFVEPTFETVVTTDAKRLNQVLTNLVSNAIKYTEKGEISIVLEDKRDALRVRVQDTGMGIEADDQKKLFAPFFRVQSDDVSQITGTGLGMWITKQLVTLLGGDVSVESIRGVGTHVVVTLPKEQKS